MDRQDPMRILAVVKGLGPGGAEHLLLTAAKVMDRDRYAVDIAYVLPWKDHLVEPLRERGVSTRCIGGRRGVRDPRWILRLRALLDRGQYDVVHLHSPISAAVARLLVRTVPRSRRPAVVSTEHNTWSSHAVATRWFNRLTFPLGDAWVCVSDEVRTSLPGRLRDRCEVLVHGIVLEEFSDRSQRDETRAELGLGPDDVMVLTVANLRRTKGYPDLLTAAQKVLERNPHVHFFAVGQGPMEEELRNIAEELGLGDRFTFLGFRRDTARLLAASDVFTMASHHEGYPIAVMEAMAAGLPVVATTVGGIPEAIVAGRQGLLIPPSEPAALAEALLEVAEDRERREEMGATAQRSTGRYDIRIAVRRMEEIYDSVARRP